MYAAVAAAALAIVMCRWCARRLDALFFSAFEFAQAELIWRSLTPLERLCGLQHWMYRRYFDRWHRRLGTGCLVSALMVPAQALALCWPRGMMAVDAGYAALCACLLAGWYLTRRTGSDGRRYAAYNAYAPLEARDRREIARQRNLLEPAALMQRRVLAAVRPAESLTQLDRQRVADRYRKY